MTTQMLPVGKQPESPPFKRTMKTATESSSVLAKAIGTFVRSEDKVIAKREELTKRVASFLEAGGCPKQLRKDLNATKLVDRRRISEVLGSFGIVSEHNEVRSAASKAGHAKKKKAASPRIVDGAGSILNLVKTQGKTFKEREEMIQLALADLRKAHKKASK